MGDSLQVCGVCGHGNAADSRFCSQCGTALAVTCQVCGTGNEPGSRFCRGCGTALTTAPPTTAAPPAAPAPATDITRYVPEELLRRIRAEQAGGTMRGERRTVTMLFADIQGSTAAADRLDPEDWAEIMNGAFKHLIAPVYRYEGTLARLAGDAILAFFGAPIAHEDDPVRAVRAGLEIVEAVAGYRADVLQRSGVPIAVRVGINTGLVVVGEVGSDLRVEYTALGDAINVAARMEQTADPGTVRVAAATAELVGDMFTMSDIGGVDVKGKAEPVRAFTVEATRQADTDRAVGALVGRTAELAALTGAVDRLHDGVGAICALVGEAGLGKSRLLAAVRSHLEELGTVATTSGQDGDVALLEGHALSFDTAVPYALMGSVLRTWWGLAPGEVPDWDTIADAVERAVGRRDVDTASLLANLAGATVPREHAELISTLETPALHHRTTEAVAAFVAAEAARRPLLLMLDDLHWGDALSLALVERLMHGADTARLVLLLALRPYRDDPSWRLLEIGDREFAHRFAAVHLKPLPAVATRELLDQLLPDSLDRDVVERILERADGNPLFVEELVRSLGQGAAAAGGSVLHDRIAVPPSLSSLLTARLDQLDDDARHVAQVAAVAGAEFEPGALAALVDSRIDLDRTIVQLVREGILVERRRTPRPVYAFRHALIQDAAYTTTLLRTRRELHGMLAEYLENAQPGAVSAIADHHLAAGAPGRAFPFLVAAAERASRTMALADAIRRFTTALDVLPADADPELVVRTHDGLGEAYGLIPDLPQAASTYQKLLDYGRSADRPPVQVTALNRLGVATFMHTGDLPRAQQYLEQARSIADSCGDQLGLAEYHLNACLLATSRGDIAGAIEHDTATADLGASQGSDELHLKGLLRRALNLMNTMRYDEAAPALAEAIDAAVALGATEPAAVLRAVGGSGQALRAGDLRGALQVLDDQLPVLERFSSQHVGHLQAQAAEIALRLGDVEGGLARASAVRRGGAAGDGTSVGIGASCMALAYALCGVRDEQIPLRREAVASLSTPMGGFFTSTVWAHLGWANLALDQVDEAAGDFARGLEVSSISRFSERPRLLAGAAFAALEHGDADEARRRLDEAEAFTAEHAVASHAGLIALGAGRLALLEGRPEDAVATLERASRVVRESGERLLDHDICVARAEAAQAQGNDDEEAGQLATARSVADVIAASIADDVLRAGLQARLAARTQPRRPVVGS